MPAPSVHVVLLIAVAAIGASGVRVSVSHADGASDVITDPGCGVLRVPMQANTVVYRLPRTFLLAGSDSVTRGDQTWQPGKDYVLDAMRGELRLLREAIPGDTIAVHACWLIDAPPLERSYASYQPAQPSSPDSSAARGDVTPVRSLRPMVARDPSRAPPGASLAVSGNKTIAVDFGANQDVFLRQSLDLAVSGSLAPGVELTGVLSDRNTPLTATGSTQDLQSLDRVLIELDAPNGKGALGDVSLALDQGEFARLERRLQGARAEWRAGSARTFAAAATAPGEFNRLQFFGVEGRQGPYVLTDRDGNLGISVVAGSEVVTVDGARMARGEAADYAMDYERARITFTNRRTITSNTRVTVEYQYASNRFRRNLVTAGSRWEGAGLRAFVQAIAEGDDRGRPVDLAFTPGDRLALEAAGDSASSAVSAGVTAGGGDYDTVRVTGGSLAYAYAGRDGGEFSVEFARVGVGRGDYSDSTAVEGRTVFRYAGAGNGAYRVGRALPLPTSHQLFAGGLGGSFGPLALEVEGALSRLDRNTFSASDDGDNLGEAGRLSLGLAGALPEALPGEAGLTLEARTVSARFESFSPLERPFAEEDWGLAPNTALDHQKRVVLSGFVRPRAGGELGASFGRLETPRGFASWKRMLDWTSRGLITSRVNLLQSDGNQSGVAFGAAGRERASGELRLLLPWIEPGVHAESDARRFASDSARAGARQREVGVALASGRALPWRAHIGAVLRRDGVVAVESFVDRTESRSVRLGFENAPGGALGVGLAFERRNVETLGGGGRARSDLANLRLTGEDRARGLNGRLNLEITSEAENRRVRELRFVGIGAGSYDALGNFVGVGDFDLQVAVSPDFERLARAASSALLSWRFGGEELWRGSRVTFDLESEASRRGAVLASDALVSPGAVLGDANLARASLLQRLEVELAPSSAGRALRVRGERRVNADRSFANFAQTLDDRTLAARWRVRPSGVVSGEVEARARRRAAEQQNAAGGRFARVLVEQGGVGQLVFSPTVRLRAVAFLEVVWAKPEGTTEATRTIKVGPDLGLSVGARGRAEITLRRAFESGPEAVGLLPSAESVAAPIWEGAGRFDYRVRESVNLGVSITARDPRDRAPRYNGRAELRAFF